MAHKMFQTKLRAIRDAFTRESIVNQITALTAVLGVILSIVSLSGYFASENIELRKFRDLQIDATMNNGKLLVSLLRNYSGRPRNIYLIAKYYHSNESKLKPYKIIVQLHSPEINNDNHREVLSYHKTKEILCKNAGNSGDCNDIRISSVEVFAEFELGLKSDNLDPKKFDS